MTFYVLNWHVELWWNSSIPCQETAFDLDVWYETFSDTIYSEIWKKKYVNKEVQESLQAEVLLE